jgi:hypothetical protein
MIYCATFNRNNLSPSIIIVSTIYCSLISTAFFAIPPLKTSHFARQRLTLDTKANLVYTSTMREIRITTDSISLDGARVPRMSPDLADCVLDAAGYGDPAQMRIHLSAAADPSPRLAEALMPFGEVSWE